MIEVTPFGFFAIFVLTFLLLINKYRVTVFVVIFFIVFDTFGVVNVTTDKSFCLNLPQYLTILSSFLFTMKRVHWKDTLGVELCLSVKTMPIQIKLGLVLIIISVLFSFLAINPEIIVFNRSGSFISSAEAIFSMRHVTQMIYLLFSIFAFGTFFKAFRVITAKEMVRTFVISVAFVAVTALLSLVFRERLAGTYSYFMNNISIGKESMYSNIVSEDSLGAWRVSGIMREPGVLSQVLLCGVVIIAVYIINYGILFGKIIDKLLIVFLIVMTITTMSSTIIIGFCVLLLALFLPMLASKKNFSSRFVRIIKFIFVVLIIVLILSSTEVFKPAYIFKYTMAKLGILKISGIGVSRLHDSKLMLQSFQQSPIFGCGYGSGFLGAGGLVTLLANVGIFGTIWFLYLFKEIIFTKITKITRNLKNPDYLALFAIRMAALNLLVIILATRNMGIGMYLPLWLLAAGSLGSFKTEKCQSEKRIPL